jgi:hypothetical protein
MVNKGVLFKKYDIPKVATGFDVNYSNINIPRGGCIFYTIDNGNLYFCLGRDHLSDELGDLGGGRKQWETICDAAARESNEESLGAFGKITTRTVMENMVIYNKYMLICFVPVVSVDPTISVLDVTRANFASQIDSGLIQKEKLEIKELVWLTYEQLLNCCMATFPDPKYSFFMRVRRFLYSFFTEWMITYHPNSTQLDIVKRPKIPVTAPQTINHQSLNQSIGYQSLNQSLNESLNQSLSHPMLASVSPTVC